MNVPYNFGGRNMPTGQILAQCVALGVSAVELRGQPIEGALGVPAAAVAEARTVLRDWRASVDLVPLVHLRRQYEDAGVQIEIVKWDDIAAMSDPEIDYCFRVATLLGARAISTEISPEAASRLAPFAEKHQMMVGLHGHASTGAAEFERAFGRGRFIGANLDLGHWVAGGHGSPLPFLTQHTPRITHIHVKDRKANNGPNVPFGEGDTPIREVLQTMRDRRWTFQATVEFEYPIPNGSNRMRELARAIAYCRQCLEG
jgi:sugar phosphate isomerase/epimerase